MADYNGYLDADQTIINYAVREMGGTFAQTLEDDPSRMLRNWLKCRRAAQNTSIGTTLFGALAVVAGVFTGAGTLLIAGVAVAAGSGFLVKHHSEGAAACEMESEILDNCRPILGLLVELEQRGASPSDLVSLYDRLVRAASAKVNPLDVTDRQQLHAFFQAELEQSAILSNLSGSAHGLGAAMKAKQPAAIALSDAPVLPNQFEPIEPPEVFSVPIEDAPGLQPLSTQPASPDSRTPPPSQPSPVAYLIGDRLRTALIVSVSGGGKDILLSNALRAFLAAYPGFRVVVADCKDDPKEYGYYDGLPNVSVHRLNVSVASDGEVIQWVDSWIEEFVHLPEQALLICNEGKLIRAKSKRYVDAVNGLVSSGDSRQKYCWEAGQSAHTKALKIDGDDRSIFRLLLIGLKGEEMQVEAILQAQCVADSARNMHDVRTQMMRSPVSRAWSDGQQWFPMPKLDNYSGYDRDSRSMLAGFVAPQPLDTRAKLEELYQSDSPSSELPNCPEGASTFPEGAEAGKSPSENWEVPGSTEEVDFQRSDDWRKYFPEAPLEVEEVVFRAYSAALEAGKRKQDFIADFLRGGTGGRRYQAASKYLDYLSEKFGKE